MIIKIPPQKIIHLMTYNIASMDMRYIEVNERKVVIQQDPDLGFIIIGEIPGCGVGCNINLEQIFIEYLMSCGDTKDQAKINGSMDDFVNRLVKLLLENILPFLTTEKTNKIIEEVFSIVINSLNIPFNVKQKSNSIIYQLDKAPFSEIEREEWQSLWIPVAQVTFSRFCDRLLKEIAPSWSLIRSLEGTEIGPVIEIAQN